MASYFGGFGGSITQNATAYGVVSWSYTADCELLDTTTTASGGYHENIAGTKKVEVSGKGFFDSAASPFSTFGLTPGTSAVMSLPHGSSGKTFAPTVRIGSVTVENEAKGVVSFNFSATSTGSYTLPS